MRFGKVILAAFLLVSVFNCVDAGAQNLNSSGQIRILNNYGSIPFEDGRTVIAEIVFTGLDKSETDFQKMLRDGQASIKVDDLFHGYKVSRAVKALKKGLLREGYLTAEIVALGEQLPNNQMRLVFEIKNAALAQVSEIRFVGNKAVSNKEYVENLKQNAGAGWKIFDEEKYEFYTKKFSRDLAMSRGYIRVRIDRVTPQLVGGSYVVTVEIDEGLRYRVGELRVRGAKVFSEKEVLAKFGLNTGDVVDAKKLHEWVYERLKKAYADQGYILYDGEFVVEFLDPQAEDADGTVNILINIAEGRQFKLGKISFVGVDGENEAKLKKLLGVSEGEIYNQTKFEDGIGKINDLKEFYSINTDLDVEVRIAEQGEHVYLVIKTQKILK